MLAPTCRAKLLDLPEASAGSGTSVLAEECGMEGPVQQELCYIRSVCQSR